MRCNLIFILQSHHSFLLICREFLDIDLTLSPEKVQHFAGIACTHINAYIAELRRLFLVEDLVDSLKFGLLLYLLTYIGAIFNGMTVVILGMLIKFSRIKLSILDKTILLICSLRRNVLAPKSV